MCGFSPAEAETAPNAQTRTPRLIITAFKEEGARHGGSPAFRDEKKAWLQGRQRAAQAHAAQLMP